MCSFLRLLHFCIRESHGIFWCPECILCGLTKCVASAPFLFSLALILHGAERGMALQLLWELGGFNPGLTAELTLTEWCLVIPLTQTCEISPTKTDQPPSYTITQLCAAPNPCVLLPNNLSQAKFITLNHHRLCLLHEFGSCMFWAMLSTSVLDISGWKSTVS